MKQSTFAALFWPTYLGAGVCITLAETYPNLATIAMIGFVLSIGFVWSRLDDTKLGNWLVFFVFVPFGALVLGVVLPFIKSKEDN